MNCAKAAKITVRNKSDRLNQKSISILFHNPAESQTHTEAMSHSHTCHHQPLQVDTQQSEPVDWLNHPAGSSCSPWRTIITGNKCDKGSTSGLFPHRLINQSHVQQRTNTQQYYRIIVWLLYLWSTVCCTTFYVFVFLLLLDRSQNISSYSNTVRQ